MAWIGKCLIAVGVVHSLFGVLFMKGTLAILWSEQLWNTVNGQPRREAVFWFLMTGALFLMVGLLVDAFENRGIAIPFVVAWLFAFSTVLGVFVMPISGLWLLIPPVAGMFFQRSKCRTEGSPSESFQADRDPRERGSRSADFVSLGNPMGFP